MKANLANPPTSLKAGTALEIQSVGLPPEIHADRVIALMLKEMAQQHARVWQAIRGITEDPHVRDGNPKAQRRMEAKVLAAGALFTELISGKRGRYTLSVCAMCGWDPVIGKLIDVDDELPPKPWICCLLHQITGTGNGNIEFRSVSRLYLTHHALSRAAQRWGVRTATDLADAIEIISVEVVRHMHDMGESWFDAIPPEGARVSVCESQCMLVLQRYENYDALAVVTVL
jgi:hypothetical protein